LIVLDASAFLVLVKGVAVVLAEDRADMGGGLIGQGWFKWAVDQSLVWREAKSAWAWSTASGYDCRFSFSAIAR
jgi:hypothetical protein